MNNERPSFPDDALTADERKALRAFDRGLAYNFSDAPSAPIPAVTARHIAEATQRRQHERMRRTWTNGFIWGAALCIIGLGGAGIIAFAAVGAW